MERRRPCWREQGLSSLFFLRNQEFANVLVKQMSSSWKTGLKIENSRRQTEICSN